MSIIATASTASRTVRDGDLAPASEARRYWWYGTALGEPVWLLVVGDDPGLLDVGRARLNELADKWAPQGPRSEIARLNSHPGVMLPVSADTILLARFLNRGPAPAPLLVDTRHGTVGRTGDQDLELGETARTVAGGLVIRELLDAGAANATIRLGSSFRSDD